MGKEEETGGEEREEGGGKGRKREGGRMGKGGETGGEERARRGGGRKLVLAERCWRWAQLNSTQERHLGDRTGSKASTHLSSHTY